MNMVYADSLTAVSAPNFKFTAHPDLLKGFEKSYAFLESTQCGILITTHLAWLGHGLPVAGLYPNLQVVSVQGLLLAGALLAWLMIPRGWRGFKPSSKHRYATGAP